MIRFVKTINTFTLLRQRSEYIIMKKIFISYRRSDAYDTDRLAKFLRVEFGHENIFFDTESMHPGVDWPESIKDFLMISDLMLLIIGPNWLRIQDDYSGRRRIDMDNDWVRLEILSFLKRKYSNENLLLIPVLVNGAKMPEKDYLDEALGIICDFQYIQLSNTGSSLDFVPLKNLLLHNRIKPINPPAVVTPITLAPPDPLTQIEEDEFLDQYPRWQIIESDKPGSPGDYMRELYRFFEFRSYEDAWKFLSKVDENGIRPFNHHPKWQNTYNRVEFWLCTFNIGHKPSKRDLRLAKILEEIAHEFI